MGNFKVGVLLVKWPDGEKDGLAPSWYHGYFCNPKKEGIARYWYEQSEGKLELEGDVLNWFLLKATTKYLRKAKGVDQIGRTKLVNAAVLQAMKERDFDVAKYDGLIVVAKIELPDGWAHDGGSGRYRLGGQDLPFSMIPAGASFNFTAHEIGHQFDLDHSYGFDCYKNIDWSLWGEYGHFYCVMSASGFGGTNPTFPLNIFPEFSGVGPGLNGGSRMARGWARGIDFNIEPGASTTQTLYSLGSSWAGNPLKVIHIIKSPEETYTVEFRSNMDDYDKGLPGPMVVINALRGSTADLGHPNTNSATYLGEIRQVGESFTSVAQFRVELRKISKDGRTAEVRVSETGKPWHRWFQVNPETVFNQMTPVAALGRRPDHLDLFKVGFDGAVWTSWWHDDGLGWRDWYQIHSQTVFSQQAAVTALARQSDHIDLFIAGFDGRIWSSWWHDDGQGWRDWFKIRPEKRFQKTTQVTAVSRSEEHVDLFAVEDGEIWSSWWHDDGQGWRAWFKIRPEKRFPTAKKVTAVGRGVDHVDLFVLDDKGVVWSSWWHDDNQGWRAWFKVEPQTNFPNYAQLTAVSRSSDHIDLFVVDNNGVVWSSWWHGDGQGWRPWFKIHPKQKFAKVAKVTAVSRSSDHIDLFVMDENGVVWSSWWHDDGQGWRPWFKIHPDIKFAVEADVTAVPRGVEQVDLFVVGFDRVVWTTSWPLAEAQPSPHSTASPIYGIKKDGRLLQTRHVGNQHGIPAWCLWKQIGNGWRIGSDGENFKQVFSGGAGIMYAITKDGDLLWYRHKGRNEASFSWDGPSKVNDESHKSWHEYKQVFSDGGAIYAIEPDGTLMWYEHIGRHDGSKSWFGPEGIGSGWHNFKFVFAGGPGIIYAIKPGGKLLWYRVSRDSKGAFSWIGPNVVYASGWNNFDLAFSNGKGLIYGLHKDGSLFWYRHIGFHDGRNIWDGPPQNTSLSGWERPVNKDEKVLEMLTWDVFDNVFI